MAVTGADFTLDPGYQIELLKGAEPSKLSAIRTVFKPRGVKTMSGAVPFIPDKYTLISSSESAHHFIGVQDNPDIFEMASAAADFRFSGKYAKEAKIHKTVVETLAELDGGEALVQYLGSVALGMVNDAFDRDGAAVLLSTTLNATAAATAAWSDPDTASPWEDFDKMVDVVGMADVCWLGLDKARELSRLPALRDESKNFDAFGGSIPLDGVVAALKGRYGFETVMIDGSSYNDANIKQNINKSRIFDGVIWVGHSSHLLPIERADLREADNEFNSRSGNFHQWVTEYITLARADVDKGVVLTGA